ncbi:MAG: hypothetical protein ACI9N1_001678 [Flavobacteriales bacterium]
MKLLIPTILLSVLSISLIDSWQSSPIYNLIGVFGPGIFFSIFVMTTFKREVSLIEKVISFVALNIMWIASLYLSFISFGLLVPVVGGGSAWWISSKLIKFDMSEVKFTSSFPFVGVITSLFGLFLFYLLISDQSSIEVCIIPVVFIWQVAIGRMLLANKDYIKDMDVV